MEVIETILLAAWVASAAGFFGLALCARPRGQIVSTTYRSQHVGEAEVLGAAE